MPRFSLVATGGTFDVVHRGHLTLLSRAFEISDRVIIGLTGDEFAERRGKTVSNYAERLAVLTESILREFPGASFQISRLDEDFGPAVLETEVQALVVSDETAGQGDVLNRLRAERGLSPVEVVTVPMRLADDGSRISTTRIKNSEIDAEGKLLFDN